MKSPSYRKITRSAKKTAATKAKASKPAKIKKPASKKVANALMAIPPAVMAGVLAINQYHKKGKKFQGDRVTNETTGQSKSRRSTESFFKKKKR